ncbi:hypothetical protein BOTNAR_0224g00070 [Botryotinia narcissicola]|uniref:Uncharacterized protein n=1 Tax=Botryotinia narcissicola TaxID=278944 RepID=A0A4Z1I513_9HELO|nr:hypothetical protein BOTNAR_0224g00070 [Botryotinia narcissicola]
MADLQTAHDIMAGEGPKLGLKPREAQAVADAAAKEQAAQAKRDLDKAKKDAAEKARKDALNKPDDHHHHHNNNQPPPPPPPGGGGAIAIPGGGGNNDKIETEEEAKERRKKERKERREAAKRKKAESDRKHKEKMASALCASLDPDLKPDEDYDPFSDSDNYYQIAGSSAQPQKSSFVSGRRTSRPKVTFNEKKYVVEPEIEQEDKGDEVEEDEFWNDFVDLEPAGDKKDTTKGKKSLKRASPLSRTRSGKAKRSKTSKG